MVVLNYLDIPLFLHRSSFYASLVEDTESFEIPDDCYVDTDSVNGPDDVTPLLKVLRFWGVDVIPRSLIAYSLEHPVCSWQDQALEFEHDLQYLADLRTICQTPATDRLLIAVHSERLEIVMYVNEERVAHMSVRAVYKNDENPYFAVAKCGNLNILKYLYEYSHPESENENSDTTNRSLYTSDWEINTHNICHVAAEYGHISCLQFLYESGIKLTGQEYTKAAINGHLNCIQFLHTCNCCWLPGVAQKATEFGYWDCLKFAIEHDCPIDNRLMCTAAGSGRLDYLQYLYSYGGKLTTECMSAAATKGHLLIMQYLHSMEVPWCAYIAQVTTLKGYLDCLQYAIKHGCPVDDTIANRAVGANQLECVKYLLSIGYRASDNAVSYAQGNNWIEVYEYLQQHNFT